MVEQSSELIETIFPYKVRALLIACSEYYELPERLQGQLKPDQILNNYTIMSKLINEKMKLDPRFLKVHFGKIQSEAVIEDLEDMYRDAKRISDEHGHHTMYLVYYCGIGLTPNDSYELCGLDTSGKGLIPLESYAKRFAMLANQASLFIFDCGRVVMGDIRQYASKSTSRVKGYSEHTRKGHTFVKFGCLANQTLEQSEEQKVVKFKDEKFSKIVQEFSLQIHYEPAIQFKQLVEKLGNCPCYGKPFEYEWLLFKDLKVKPNIYSDQSDQVQSLSQQLQEALSKKLITKRIDHTFALTHWPLSAPKFLLQFRDSYFIGGQLEDCLELQFQHTGKIGLQSVISRFDFQTAFLHENKIYLGSLMQVQVYDCYQGKITHGLKTKDYVYSIVNLGSDFILCGMRNGHIACISLSHKEAISEFKLPDSFDKLIITETKEGPIYSILGVGPGGLYFLEVDATYQDYEISLIDHRFKGQYITSIILVKKDVYLLSFQHNPALLLYNRVGFEQLEELPNPYEKTGDCIYRSIKCLLDGQSYIVRSDQAIYLLDFMRNQGNERWVLIQTLYDEESGENTDTLLVDKKEQELHIITTQTIRIDQKSSKHKIISFSIDLK